MTDHITEKKVESEGKVFNKNRGKTVSKSKVFDKRVDISDMITFLQSNVEYGVLTDRIKNKYTLTITKHLD